MRACFRSGQNQATALSRSVASTCCGFDERNAQWLRVRSPALCCCSKPQLLFVSEKCCSSADFYLNAFPVCKAYEYLRCDAGMYRARQRLARLR